MPSEVTVHGAGLAGLTCSLLLARSGHRVTLVGAPPSSQPTDLVLNEPTMMVLTRVWGVPGDRLLASGHALTTRRIRWGPDAVEQSVPAPAVVVNAPQLLRSLERRLLRTERHRVVSTEAPEPDHGQWAIHATASRDSTTSCPPVGRRCALIAHAPLAHGVPATVSRMATTTESWLYLAPLGDGRTLIQAMTPAPPLDPVRYLAAELAAARLDGWLAEQPDRVSVVPAAPWLAPHHPTPGHVRIGGAALRLDPVSGAGAGHALRTAILAAAVIRGVNDGLPAATALDHYTQRLRAAFADHLASCTSYYRAAFTSAAWANELHATATALTTHAEPLRDRQFELTLRVDRLTPK